VWRPYFQPRYTLYALPGFYLCVTWAVFRIRSLKLRSLVAALYAFLLISQTMLFLPATTRTNWIAATREISTQASPNDVAIAVLNPFYEIFFENAPDFPIPLLDSSANEAGVLRTLPDVIEAYFAQCDENTLIETSAWCVVLRSYLNDPWQELEAALSGKGFQYTSQLFSGGEHLLLYRVRPGASVCPSDSPPCGPGPLERAISAADDPELFISTLRNQIRKHNYLMGSLTPFFLHPQPHDQLRQTCARLERAGILPYSGIRLWNKDTPVTNTGIHGLLKDNGSPITCRLIFRFALTQSLWENRIQTERDLTDLFTKQTIPRADSSGVESHLEMAALWQELGKDEEALAILSTALQDDSKNPRLLLGQAGCLFALGRVAEGNRIIDDVTQNNPLAAMMIDQIRASCGRSIRTLDDGTGGTESFPTGTVAKPSFCETANRKPL
jgi:hypothetical protein